MAEQDPGKRFITNAELQSELAKRPTTWQVAAMVLGGVVLQKVLASEALAPSKTPVVSSIVDAVLGLVS